MCKDKVDDLMVFHGTGQDMGSKNELTVRLVEAAQDEGREVFQLGGPGSTERSLKAPFGLAQPSSLHEIDIPLDYAYKTLAGVAVGEGIGDIVDEGMEAFMKKINKSSSIHLIGFSRGAVAIALMLEMAGKHLDKQPGQLPNIRVTLLDPVPGPIGIKQHITLPRCVTELNLLYSKHEGRPGFQHLDISLSRPIRFNSDMNIGVHGDIGGSTQSPLALTNQDRVMKSTGLPGLGQRQMHDASLDAFLNATNYSDRLKWQTRQFKSNSSGIWLPSDRADFEMPSDTANKHILYSPLANTLFGNTPDTMTPQMESVFKREFQQVPHLQIQLIEKWEKRMKGPSTIMYNPKPFVGTDKRVYTPPPIILQLPTMSKSFGSKLISVLKYILK